MPLNRDHIGRSTTSTEPFDVTRSDIRRFATAIRDTNPAYHDPAAAQALGHRDLVAPPTFLITLGMSTQADLITDPGLGLDYSLVVHGEQSFELHRAVCAGDQLDTVTRIDGMRDAGRNELLSVVTEVRCDGQHVATATNTIVSRGTAAPRPAAPVQA